MDLIRKYPKIFSYEQLLLLKQLLEPIHDQSDDTFVRQRAKLYKVPAFLTKELNKLVEHTNLHFELSINNPIEYESFTYGQYSKGHSCALHNDLCTTCFFRPTTRKFSVVIAMNDSSNYKGGAFTFHATNDINDLNLNSIREFDRFKLDAGDVAIYPSFVYHEVEEVTEGVRESLTTMVLGPAYK